MRQVDSIKRSVTLLTILSIVYALLNGSMIMLAPILTVVIPYRFMREKDNLSINRKVLNNLLVFNIFTFIIGSLMTNKISIELFEIISNLLMVYVYYALLARAEQKREELQKNPQKLYETIIQRINTLEFMSKKIDEDIENARNEKSKNSMERRKEIIEKNINELKQQANHIKKSSENNNAQGL